LALLKTKKPNNSNFQINNYLEVFSIKVITIEYK